MGDESDLIDDLRTLAGAASDADSFSVERDAVRFSVDYHWGSSSSLFFVASYDAVARAGHPAIARAGSLRAVRPMEITLRAETAADEKAKRAGVNVEHQTGDAAFDREVYVSTPTTDEALLRAVLGPKVRDGVRTLLALGFKHVQIDHGGNVVAHLFDFAQRTPRPGRGARAVEAFFLVLSDLPRVAASGGVHPEFPRWASDNALAGAGIAAVTLFFPVWLAILDANRCTFAASVEVGSSAFRGRCGAPTALALLTGLVAAAIAGAVAARLVTPRLRGRADSAGRIFAVRAAVFVAVFVAAFLVASAIGFALVPR